MKFKNDTISQLNYVINIEIDVLISYINKVESDISFGIESYKEKINIVKEEEIEIDGQFHYHSIEECDGLDSDNVNFESLFEEYFPQLQRSSALITLCGFFEHQIFELCRELQIEKSLIKIKGIKIADAISYLQDDVKINSDEAKNIYDVVTNIYHVRNRFAHEEGLINDKVRNFIQTNEYLSGDVKIKIHPGFLQYMLNIYKATFEIIRQELIDKY